MEMERERERRLLFSSHSHLYVIGNGWIDARIEMKVKMDADSLLQKFKYVLNNQNNEI